VLETWEAPLCEVQKTDSTAMEYTTE
jgi:hypothetical protein